jgi:hypothetical protein
MTARLNDLKDMRDLLWESVRQADPDKRAPLFARLESVIEQIDDLSPTEKAGDPVDEIAKRRSARGAGAATSASRAKAK